MLKITILLFILSTVSYIVFKCLVNSMTKIEIIRMEIGKDTPTRCVVALFITTLLFIATFVCLIITIITW